MRVEYATADDIRTVALDMREADFREFIALSAADSREALAAQLVTRFAGRSDVMTGFDDRDRPVAVAGLVEHRPNVLSALFFATDDFESVALEVTYIAHRLLRDVRATNVHRIEAVSMVGHDQAHRWIRHFGLKPEGPPMRCFGKNGEDYQQFAWVRCTSG